MTKYVSFDCEADGYSMVSFGAVDCDDLTKTFYAELRPISDKWEAGALKASGLTREQTLQFPDPEKVMNEFDAWVKALKGNDRIMLVTDNPWFDASYLNLYFKQFVGKNPFGWSSLSLTSLYKGFARDMKASFKHLRETRHSHNALDDAMGNAQAFRAIRAMGMKF